jgi:molybdopterin/thiamine biosynthesis adenylyltransferase
MDDAQLLRYSRHILLPELGVDAQQRFATARALIIGVGGLGNPVAQFLAAAGVGTLTLVDADSVDLTNLQRQILFDTHVVGAAKVDAAAQRLAAINPEVRIVRVAARVGDAELAPLAADADIVVDCSDNFATRHAVNRACVAARKPLVSGAGDDFEETRCATMGVFAPLVGIIGASQAAEVLKLLASAGDSLAGRLLMLDALAMEWREVRVLKDPQCAVCAPGANR